MILLSILFGSSCSSRSCPFKSEIVEVVVVAVEDFRATYASELAAVKPVILLEAVLTEVAVGEAGRHGTAGQR